jgi:hypothetical protein
MPAISIREVNEKQKIKLLWSKWIKILIRKACNEVGTISYAHPEFMNTYHRVNFEHYADMMFNSLRFVTLDT